MHRPIAAIDLGTNTARLLVGFVERPGEIRPILIRRWITRLGSGFTREAGIAKAARERSVEALTDFADEIKRCGVSRVRAVATSAVRDAVNGKSFCDEIYERNGIMLEIIDSDAEGYLTLQGVLSAVKDDAGNLLVFDIGGGSTEYTIALNGKPVFTESLPLGVVRLTEGKRDVESMEEKISRELDHLYSSLSRRGLIETDGRLTLVGTAGTATTLAAISLKMTDYIPARVNNYTLFRQEILDIYSLLSRMTLEERLSVPGLEKGREDLIIAGILVTLKTMEIFGFPSLKVSDSGLLEGVLLSI